MLWQEQISLNDFDSRKTNKNTWTAGNRRRQNYRQTQRAVSEKQIGWTISQVIYISIFVNFTLFFPFLNRSRSLKRRKDCSSYNWNDLISKVPQIQSYKLTWSSTDILTLNGSSSTFIIPCSFAVASLSNRDKSCWRSFSEKER